MPSQIPLPYRILLLYFEPLAALNGAILAHFLPTFYLSIMAPSTSTSTSTSSYNPSTQIIFTQLSACYLLFAFNEAIVLRQTTDLRVWKAMVAGILLCDAVHLYASYVAMGEGVWRVAGWRMEEWVNVLMILGPGAMRVGLLAEVGFKEGKGKGKVL